MLRKIQQPVYNKNTSNYKRFYKYKYAHWYASYSAKVSGNNWQSLTGPDRSVHVRYGYDVTKGG